MSTKKASQEYSAGARYERAALRMYLERMIRTRELRGSFRAEYREILAWVLRRQKRYAKRPGGL
jgi:hypothetical protein